MKYIFLCIIGGAVTVIVIAGTIRIVREIFRKN